MLTQEGRINLNLLKKIMTEKKTTLAFRRNQDWKRGRNRKGKRIIDKCSKKATSMNKTS